MKYMRVLAISEPAMFRGESGSIWSSWCIANGPNSAPMSRAKIGPFSAVNWFIFAKK